MYLLSLLSAVSYSLPPAPTSLLYPSATRPPTLHAFAAQVPRNLPPNANSLPLTTRFVSPPELALDSPDCMVVGVDRSEVRLSRGMGLPPNALVVRADLPTFWRLMARSSGPLSAQRLVRHCIFYPNPYPKPSQRRKRWGSHPALPTLLSLGGSLELRSNWRVYLEEFDQALQAVAGASEGASELRLAASRRLPGEITRVELGGVDGEDAISNFEQKFYQNGNPLWQLDLPATGP